MQASGTAFGDAPKRILAIDDDELFVASLALNLSPEGYRVLMANRGEQGLTLAERANPDLIILDILLPDVSGFDVCRRLRERGNPVAIILVSGKTDETDLIVGLEVGADDYVTKPCSPRELLARVRAQLRRQAMRPVRPAPLYRFHDFEVDFESQGVTRGGRAIALSPREFDILQLLIRYRGQVVSRNTLLAVAWGYDYLPTTRTVDNHIVKLRRKLEDDPSHPRHILSVYGEGYKFVARTRGAEAREIKSPAL